MKWVLAIAMLVAGYAMGCLAVRAADLNSMASDVELGSSLYDDNVDRDGKARQSRNLRNGDGAEPPVKANLLTQANAFNGRTIDLLIVKQDLKDVLQAIGEQAGVQITLSKGLSATVGNMRLNGNLRSSMDQLAQRIGAVWWWNNRELRIASRRDSVTRSIKTENAEYVLQMARQLQVPADVLTITRSPTLGVMRVTGPRALVSDLEDLAKNVGPVKVVRYGRADK